MSEVALGPLIQVMSDSGGSIHLDAETSEERDERVADAWVQRIDEARRTHAHSHVAHLPEQALSGTAPIVTAPAPGGFFALVPVR
jgi:hypothetical protein